ncbi:MAG: enoyl-CoA hydratase/isomerase family protein [Burkholderiales bacterium]|nr:MAG: enoyl-CoA hydratase/isomerase family protein [Burkholderiales bacterium]
MSGFEFLRVERRDSILRVTIDRPEQRNPLSTDVLGELRRAFAEAAADETLRAAVVTGAGDRSFAAGGDLKEFDRLRSPEDAGRLWSHANEALRAVREFPLPVVAALNGVALGGGAELAVACDFRVAAPHAAIGFIQGRLNICTGFGGGADLVALVGGHRALSILIGAETMPAVRAREAGLVDEIAADGESLEQCVERFLQPLCAQAPQVLRAFKTIVLSDRLALPRVQREQRERQALIETWIHPDHWQASDRFLSRSPRGAA